MAQFRNFNISADQLIEAWYFEKATKFFNVFQDYIYYANKSYINR